MRFFLDTEFTCLVRPQLISIGMVSEDGQEFYRELKDTWTLAGCSLFVMGWVLPWLSGGMTGEYLYSKLQSTLDLIQYETDSDNLFSKQKESLLTQHLASDSALMDHFRFLSAQEASSLYVREAPFLAKQLRGLRPESILSGEQVQTGTQVSHDLLEWLNSFDGKPTICVDSYYDKDMLQTLIDRRLKFELVPNLADHSSGLQLHHALDDARALRIGFLAESEQP